MWARSVMDVKPQEGDALTEGGGEGGQDGWNHNPQSDKYSLFLTTLSKEVSSAGDPRKLLVLLIVMKKNNSSILLLALQFFCSVFCNIHLIGRLSVRYLEIF